MSKNIGKIMKLINIYLSFVKPNNYNYVFNNDNKSIEIKMNTKINNHIIKYKDTEYVSHFLNLSLYENENENNNNKIEKCIYNDFKIVSELKICDDNSKDILAIEKTTFDKNELTKLIEELGCLIYDSNTKFLVQVNEMKKYGNIIVPIFNKNNPIEYGYVFEIRNMTDSTYVKRNNNKYKNSLDIILNPFCIDKGIIVIKKKIIKNGNVLIEYENQKFELSEKCKIGLNNINITKRENNKILPGMVR